MRLQLIWQVAKRALLWVGLALCGLALWRTRTLSGEAVAQMPASGWVLISVLLAGIWLLATASWRTYLRAYALQDTSWTTAARQLGLLLIGKYLPGGIFGFLMRIYDQPQEQRRKLFHASLVDQCSGLALPILLGLLLTFMALHEAWPAALLLPLLPTVAVAAIMTMHAMARHVPKISAHFENAPPPRRELLLATSLQLLQVISWAALAAFLTTQLYGLNTQSALGVSGAYLLAVSGGMLVIILPSGIGAREAILVALGSHWIETNQAIHLAALLRILSSAVDVVAGAAAAAIKSGSLNANR